MRRIEEAKCPDYAKKSESHNIRPNSAQTWNRSFDSPNDRAAIAMGFAPHPI